MKTKMNSIMKFFLLLGVLCTIQFVHAQAPQKMNFQAVIRNSSNAIVSSSAVGMRISILQGSASGPSVYTETQVPSTNVSGLVSLEIGTGTVVSGTFSTINWALGPYFIKTETDPTGGSSYTIIGTTQLTSVPYALFSATSGSGETPGTAVGDMKYWNGTAWVMIPVGTSGQFLQLNSSNIPSWLGASFPTLTTLPITDINQYGAFSGVNVTSDGGGYVTAKGVCYSTTPNPTLSSNIGIFSNLPGIGSWSHGIGLASLDNVNYNYYSGSLVPNTTYYVRAYATNSAGTVYGNQQVFTTLNNSSPNVSTNAPTNLLASSVSFTGFASYPIDNPITSRGFCYGTSPLPTLSNSVVNTVSGNGPMSANVSTLLPSTTYYVRSYATNGNGTSYGNEFTFTTCIAPSFTVGQSYGGGTIFYVDCTGIHGLIAANTEYGPVQWGCEGTSISGTLSGIGTGQSNTNLILSGCSDTNFAAKLCDNLTLNTYSDWYLPSYDELETLRVNIGGFANVYIWSSSQKDINDAYSKNLGNPTVQWYFNKSNNGIVYVRPIRSF